MSQRVPCCAACVRMRRISLPLGNPHHLRLINYYGRWDRLRFGPVLSSALSLRLTHVRITLVVIDVPVLSAFILTGLFLVAGGVVRMGDNTRLGAAHAIVGSALLSDCPLASCSICVFEGRSFFAMLGLLNSWCDALNCFVALGFGDRSAQPFFSLSSQIAATACGGGAIAGSANWFPSQLKVSARFTRKRAPWRV